MAGRSTLLVLLFLLTGCASAPTVSDAAAVYCTAKGRQSETLEAAASLKLVDSTSFGNRVVVGGKTLSFDEWRDQRRADFVKACNALAEPVLKPASPSSSPVWVSTVFTMLASLLVAGAGAWAAWFTANRREDRTRGKQHAVSLRTASNEFVAAVREYCDVQLKGSTDGTPPSAAELWRKRDLLANQFAVTALLWPDWTAPRTLRGEAMAFGDGVASGWQFDRNRTELRPRAAELNAAAAKLDGRVEVLARALERPSDAEKLFAPEFGEGARA
ncbi:hypothetical protein SAMN04488564_101932 [Lentzea waywayandensis]|uniref:DUF4129 domain-containing protein n=1 Tax=Lentzea waywayandensis TaxID=84724 RepID=A0A1I6D301_9PSEU|nr:hypothetical protein [Lentzea waywayandensis]SFQ99810.1 hypothetical protein SAMN04488564_101932 [Lentzea waywayandensis]